MRISLKKAAVVIAAAGLSLGLLGMGVGASFTDGGTATENISVGTMGITVTSSTAGAVVVNTGNQGTHTVTFTCPTIQSSVAGSCPLDFQVNNTGSMQVVVTVVSSDGFVAPWSDNFVNPGAQTIAVAGHYDYTGGIKWTALSNADLGSNHSVTYTISATA